VKDSDRVSYINMEQGFNKVTATYGFMETSDVPEILHRLQQQDVIPKMVPIRFYPDKETLEGARKNRSDDIGPVF